jgi:hypothetical protein
VDFTSPAVKPHVLRLHQAFRSRISGLLLPVVGNPERADELGAAFEASPEAGAGLLLAVLAVYQAYFHRLFPHVARIPSIHIPEEPHMKFVLLGPSRDSFRQALCAAGIQFEEQPMRSQPGEIANSAGEVIQIVGHPASSGATLASVTCAWLKAQPTRTINITTKDNKVIHTADLNVKELEQFLEVARKILIVDTDRSPTKADSGG